MSCRWMASVALVLALAVVGADSARSEHLCFDEVMLALECEYGHTDYVSGEGFATPASPRCQYDDANCPELTLSLSDADPFETEGPLEPNGVTTLYIWYACDTIQTNRAALSALSGDLEVVAHRSRDGHLDLDEASGVWGFSLSQCAPPVLIGEFDVARPVGVETEGWGRIKARYSR